MPRKATAVNGRTQTSARFFPVKKSGIAVFMPADGKRGAKATFPRLARLAAAGIGVSGQENGFRG
jgi:hypothetical protein